MRLFSPKETKKVELKDQVRESIYLAKKLREQDAEWNERKKTLDPEKQRLEKDFLSFSHNLQQKRSDLLRDIAVLEERREQALEPLNAKWYELTLKEADLESRALLLAGREHQLSEDRSDLIDQLSFFEDKKNQLAERERGVIADEQTIALQRTLLTASTDDLNKKWQAYHLRERDLITQAADLETQRLANVADREALKAGEDILINDRQDLATYKRQLDDRQATLERSWNELRTKQTHGQSTS